jgi:hypothetical protein
VAAAGFFGPGILAELGIVRLEEFRQETSRRVAHQAFLVAGFVALIHGAATVARWRPRIAAALVVAAMVWMLVLSGAWRLVATSNGFPWEISFEIVIYFLLLPGTAVLALVFGGQESE